MKYNLENDAKVVNKEYKQMEYKADRIQEILLEGIFKDYHFYILNLGTNPTAYIEIPVSSKLYGLQYDEIYRLGYDIECHYGLTYSSNKLSEIKDDSWFIGWDYAHAGDYMGYDINFPERLKINDDKKWTTEEIYNEVCCVIDQIIEIDTINKTKYDEIKEKEEEENI